MQFNQKQIHRRTTSCVYTDHTSQTDESHVFRYTLPASTSLHFTAATQTSDLSQVGGDVFQLAPFKRTPARCNKMVLSSIFTAEPSDVFLQAPFVRRQDTNNSHVLQSASQCPLLPEGCPLRSPLRPTEGPLLQQAVAVHRVVSRVGQQAAVGSVAVGPLHAWTIAGRPTEDPFTGAPFSSKCSQENSDFTHFS